MESKKSNFMTNKELMNVSVYLKPVRFLKQILEGKIQSRKIIQSGMEFNDDKQLILPQILPNAFLN